MGHPEDRRGSSRLPAEVEAELETPSGSRRVVRLSNLSLRGLFAPGDHGLDPGEMVWARLHLGSPGWTADAGGYVVRASAEGLAIRFDELPYESLDALARYLRSLAVDPETIDEEILDQLGRLTHDDRPSGAA